MKRWKWDDRKRYACSRRQLAGGSHMLAILLPVFGCNAVGTVSNLKKPLNGKQLLELTNVDPYN